MHKAQIAELILSLFTSRERAASTVGDLIEKPQAVQTGRSGRVYPARLYRFFGAAFRSIRLLWRVSGFVDCC